MLPPDRREEFRGDAGIAAMPARRITCGGVMSIGRRRSAARALHHYGAQRAGISLNEIFPTSGKRRSSVGLLSIRKRERKENNMTTFQGPFLIQAIGQPQAQVCLQATYDGVNATVQIQPIDATGKTLRQQWLYGSDQRLYLNATTPKHCIHFDVPAQDSQALLLADVVPSDQTQQWAWSNVANSPTIINVGAQPYVMDNADGGTSPGNTVQIYTGQGSNSNQYFAMVLIPALAPSA
jgi:hypothetical protein